MAILIQRKSWREKEFFGKNTVRVKNPIERKSFSVEKNDDGDREVVEEHLDVSGNKSLMGKEFATFQSMEEDFCG